MTKADVHFLERTIEDYRRVSLTDEQIARAIEALTREMASSSREGLNQFLVDHGLPASPPKMHN